MELGALPEERACGAWVWETQMEEEIESERDGFGHAFEEVEMKKWWFGEAFFFFLFAEWTMNLGSQRWEGKFGATAEDKPTLLKDVTFRWKTR